MHPPVPIDPIDDPTTPASQLYELFAFGSDTQRQRILCHPHFTAQHLEPVLRGLDASVQSYLLSFIPNASAAQLTRVAEGSRHANPDLRRYAALFLARTPSTLPEDVWQWIFEQRAAHIVGTLAERTDNTPEQERQLGRDRRVSVIDQLLSHATDPEALRTCLDYARRNRRARVYTPYYLSRGRWSAVRHGFDWRRAPLVASNLELELLAVEVFLWGNTDAEFRQLFGWNVPQILETFLWRCSPAGIEALLDGLDYNLANLDDVLLSALRHPHISRHALTRIGAYSAHLRGTVEHHPTLRAPAASDSDHTLDDLLG